MEEADRLKKIKKQIEFYFGDSNLPNDKFLRETIAADEGGYVPIEVLVKFRRMETLKATIEDIVKLFEGSTFIGFSEDKLKMKRLTPLPSVDDSSSRKLFVKNLPKTATQEHLEIYFDKLEPDGIASVRMIRSKKIQGRPFVGAIFVEFKTVDQMNRVLSKAEELKYEEEKLTIMTFDDFIRSKKEMVEKGRKEKKRKRGIEMFQEKLKEVKEKFEGCVLKIRGIPTEPSVTFKDIKRNAMEVAGATSCFVEYPYKDDRTTAVIRFPKKEFAEKFVAGVGDESIKLIGEGVEVLGEEEKEEFFKKFTETLMQDETEPVNKKRKLD